VCGSSGGDYSCHAEGFDCTSLEPDYVSNCIVVYRASDSAPAGSGGNNLNWNDSSEWPNSFGLRADYLAAHPSATLEVIDFEDVALGNFAGSASTHPLTADNSGTMEAGTAVGTISLSTPSGMGVDLSLISTGMSAGIDNPGIAEVESDTDADRGFNVTPGGSRYLEVLPSEQDVGRLSVSFLTSVQSTAFFLMGREHAKRDVDLIVYTGDSTIGLSEVVVNPTVAHGQDLGGIEFIVVEVREDIDGCYPITGFTLIENFEAGVNVAGDRDIFAVDDIYIDMMSGDIPDGGGSSGSCGDGICNADENAQNCLEDCPDGGQGLQPEDTDARCSDGVDNDADGLVDCSDSECRTLAVCGGDPAGGGNSGYGDGNPPPDGGGNGP
ncbi:MAG: hypothetical protein VX210_13890, partial [Myxococcota bacterium]|nr:hypothetical protein [Myxococcota bacterium]